MILGEGDGEPGSGDTGIVEMIVLGGRVLFTVTVIGTALDVVNTLVKVVEDSVKVKVCVPVEPTAIVVIWVG